MIIEPVFTREKQNESQDNENRVDSLLGPSSQNIRERRNSFKQKNMTMQNIQLQPIGCSVEDVNLGDTGSKMRMSFKRRTNQIYLGQEEEEKDRSSSVS